MQLDKDSQEMTLNILETNGDYLLKDMNFTLTLDK
jgi:hypothetical protein